MKIFRLSRSRAALLGAFLLPILASCGGGGGGGGGNKNPSIDSATPAPTTKSTLNCTSESFTPNYANSVSLLRWDRFPLRVFFIRNDQLSDSRQQTAQAGFNQWVAATGNRADYILVDSASQANVTVSFYTFTGGSGDTLGTARVTFDDNNVLRSAKIELGITGNAANDRLTAAHEYGHTLGITGHSPRTADLMYFTGNANGEITNYDLNTARTAYCDDFNRSTGRTKAAVGPLKTIVMH
jgi:predicted Zn-dependent protease